MSSVSILIVRHKTKSRHSEGRGLMPMAVAKGIGREGLFETFLGSSQTTVVVVVVVAVLLLRSMNRRGCGKATRKPQRRGRVEAPQEYLANLQFKLLEFVQG